MVVLLVLFVRLDTLTITLWLSELYIFTTIMYVLSKCCCFHLVRAFVTGVIHTY